MKTILRCCVWLLFWTTTVPASGQDQTLARAEILRDLRSSDFGVWSEAVDRTLAGNAGSGPEVEAALIGALEQVTQWSIEKNQGLDRPLVGELGGLLLMAVAEMRDPRAIPSLAWYANSGSSVSDALMDFGLESVAPLLEVAFSPWADGSQTDGALKVMAALVETYGTEAFADGTLARIREAALLRLPGDSPEHRASSSATTTNMLPLGAIRLAGVLRGPELLGRLAVLAASTPQRLGSMGLVSSLPGSSWIRTCAAARLAGEPPPAGSVCAEVPKARRR